ncbi:MAG: IS200/IS605 family transposase [Chitinophagaceae bacterium]
MPHSFVKCWVHALWATKNRQPLIKTAIEDSVYNKMKEELIKSGCFVQIINGMPDHVHCLFSANPQLSVSDTIEQLKGSSSHWFNQQDLITEKFAWQTGYAAYSVSQSQLEKVFNYIKNQKVHHQQKTWQQELDELNELHGLNRNNPNE